MFTSGIVGTATIFAGLLFLAACDDPAPAADTPRQQAAAVSDFDWYWDYALDRVDLTHAAIFGETADFEVWAAAARVELRRHLDATAVPTARLEPGEIRPRAGYTLRAFMSDQGDALLAVPDAPDPTKPVVIALHGHELPHRGALPWLLFDSWADHFATDGYVVFAPAHLWYDRVAGKRHPQGSRAAELDTTWHEKIGSVDYPVEWAARVSVLLDAVEPHLPPHQGSVAVGLSAGGLTGAVLMAARADVEMGVFAGSFTVLDFNREHYRIAGHPNNWDISWINSYSTIFALLAPRPVQWQLGRHDNYWPGTEPGVKATARSPGFARRPMADETWGQFLVLERIWSKFGARPSFHVHDGGHVVDYPATLAFVAAHH